MLFQIQAHKENKSPFRRFEIDCQFLSRINHPNIVQYLGTYYDPETSTPALLMELMDESLTHFLESLPENLPCHTQVNLSYDIAQALTFLHSNGIIHCNLSSNNVLLLASTRAKVTDFGMSKLIDLNTTRLATVTTCPGTPAFMSPEALNEPPVYTEKLDNFSFGVLLIQIATRQFPKPTDRFEVQQLVNPKFPNKVIEANVRVPESERRQAHIDLIPPDHPLLPTAFQCLKDNDSQRPTTKQLCETLTVLKRTPSYQKSFQQNQLLGEKNTQLIANQEKITQQDKQLIANQASLIQKDEQLLAYQEAIAQKDIQLQSKENTITQINGQLQVKDDQLLAKNRELDQAEQNIHTIRNEVGAREEQLTKIHLELQSSKEISAALQKTIQERDREVSELRQELTSKNIQQLSTQMHHVTLQDKSQAPSLRPLKVSSWKLLSTLRAGLFSGSSTVIGNKAYIKPDDSDYAYVFSDYQRDKLYIPSSKCTIASVDNILTAVGGQSISCSIELFSCIDGRWVERFPPIPTKRLYPAVVYTNSILVVAGGCNLAGQPLTTVEILNTTNDQWSSASSLPVAIGASSATICGSFMYIHPHIWKGEANSVYKCSVEQLVRSKPSSAIWEKITALPVSYSSLITVNDQLLAVGGAVWGHRNISIYQYINTLWTVVGHMTSPRSQPVTAVLPGNKLMVVGGSGASRKCELATIS